MLQVSILQENVLIDSKGQLAFQELAKVIVKKKSGTENSLVFFTYEALLLILF